MIPYDLEDVEVERLRDAPALGPAAAADVLQGLGMDDVEQQLRGPGAHKGAAARQNEGAEGRGPRSSEDSGGEQGTPTAAGVRHAAAGGMRVLLPPGAPEAGRDGMGSSRQGSRLLGAPDSQVCVYV